MFQMIKKFKSYIFLNYYTITIIIIIIIQYWVILYNTYKMTKQKIMLQYSESNYDETVN